MSFNGSGTFNINSTGQPVVSGTVISSSTFNTLTADLATGLSTCITKDGQTTVTANIPMNSYKITGLAAGTAATDAARVGQLQAGAASVVTAAGTDTYTGTMSPSLGAYAAGNTFTFVVPNTNTTAATLNIDGLGAKALTRDGSTALVAGDLVANAEVLVVYDGTRFQVLNSNSKTNFNLSGTLTVAGNTTLSGGTANGVAYLNASKVLTTGSALTFDGATFTNSGAIRTSDELSALGGRLALYRSAGSSYFDWASGQDLIWRTVTSVGGAGASELMRLTSTGLGIGTSSPSSKLDVSSSVGSTPAYNNATVKVISTATAAVGTGSSIVFSGQTGNSTASYAFAGIQGVKGSATAGDYSGSLLFLTQNSGGGLLLTEAARIDSSGNLGLGVTPSAWSGPKAFQLAGSSAISSSNSTLDINANAYYNGGYKYISSAAATLYTQTSGQHQWFNAASGTAGNPITFTQAMTLDASGNLLVGTTTTFSASRVTIQGNATYATSILGTAGNTTSNCLFLALGGNRSADTTYSLINYVDTDGTGTARFRVYGNGNVVNTNNSYGAISDIKLKENIVDATPKLDKLLQVRVVNYNLIGEPDNKQLGVVAQELEQVFPAMVSQSPDFDADGNDLGTTTKSVKYSVFVPMLIKAMQEQQALIESLTARLNSLENK